MLGAEVRDNCSDIVFLKGEYSKRIAGNKSSGKRAFVGFCIEVGEPASLSSL